MFFKKYMSEYKMFENVKIDLGNLPNTNDELNKVCENGDYVFYNYKDEKSFRTYLLGQLKSNPKKVFMVGNSYDHVCIYKNNLFLCNEVGELNTKGTLIHRIDLDKKDEETYDFRWKFGKMVNVLGYGRFYTTDHYMGIKVENNELIISGHREKSNDERYMDDAENCDMNFQIVFKYENNKFVPYFITDNGEFSFKKNNV